MPRLASVGCLSPSSLVPYAAVMLLKACMQCAASRGEGMVGVGGVDTNVWQVVQQPTDAVVVVPCVFPPAAVDTPGAAQRCTGPPRDIS